MDCYNDAFENGAKMRQNFAEQLEQMITNKADDFAVSKLFKDEKAAYAASLFEQFAKTHPKGFLVHHSRAIEEFITFFYRFVLRGAFGDFVPPVSALPIVFVALGSFGREQCAPSSDVDLMIVYKETAGYNLKPLIERVLYLAWDAGFHLGHRVHEVSDLEEASKTDITIKTAMLEGRFFYGSKLLWVEIETALRNIRHNDQQAYVAQKIDEYRARRAKKPITMEPDIKEGAGSLRDANALFWIANALYGVSSTKDLVGREIRDDDYRVFHQALETLFRVRCALHLLCKKKVDTLLLQYQREVALFLGYNDTKMRKAERFLLKKVLNALGVMDRHCAYYIAKLTRQKMLDNVINCGFESDIISSEKSLKELLQIALNAPLNNSFDISFIMALYRAKIPRQSKTIKEIIWQFFYRSDCHKFFEALAKADRLEALIEPLKHITDLAQFDGYHTRPADEHSILTLALINTLGGVQKELFDAFDAKEQALLRLVALLHDCGKGGNHNHCETGAKRFREFAISLGLDDQLIETGMHLIRAHTMMSTVARSEDIYSDKTVFAFASKIGSRNSLTMLYLLTICDMSAVANGIYTHFTADVLRELYYRSINALEKDEQLSEAASRIRKEKQLTVFEGFTALNPHLQKQILSIDSTLFFLKFKPQEIITLALRVKDTKRVSFHFDQTPSFTIDVISKEPFNLGWLLGKLAWLDLGAMDIFKLFDGAKFFRMYFRKTPDEPLEELSALITDSLNMTRTMSYKKPLIKKKEITVDCDHSPTYAKMYLNVPDQQGLMAFVIDLFDRRGIDIAAAKIATVKNRAQNLFLIEKSGGFCNEKDAIINELTRS